MIFLSKHNLLIDADPGMGFIGSDVDDNLAIMLADRSDAFELVGVSLTSGNVRVEKGHESLDKFLKLIKREDVPFALGSKEPLVSKYSSARELKMEHVKENGLSINFNEHIENHSLSLEPSPKHASDFIIELVKKYEGNLVIAAVAPLTNIALAINKAPEVMKKLKKMIIMGGAFNYPGNISPVAELNVKVDPIAARIVMNFNIDKTVVGLNVTEQVSLSPDDILDNLAGNEETIDFFSKFVSEWVNMREVSLGQSYFYPHDPVALTYLEKPSLFKKEDMFIKVIDQKGFCNGQTVGIPTSIASNYKMSLEERPVCEVATDIDVSGFKRYLFKRLSKK